MRAGFAETEITPPVGTPLAGFAARDHGSEGLHDPLHSKALVLDDGTTRLCLITNDVLGLSADLVGRIRAQIEATESRGKDNDELAEASKALKDELAAIEKNLLLVDSTNPRPGPIKIKEKFGALSGMIDESDDPPTMNAHSVYTLLSEQLEEELTKLHHIASEDAVSFNNLVQKAAIPALVP